MDATEEKSKDLHLNLSFPVLTRAFPLDLSYVALHQASDREHATLIILKEVKYGKVQALEEETIRGINIKIHDGKVFFPNSICRELVDWFHDHLQNRCHGGTCKKYLMHLNGQNVVSNHEPN